MVACQGQSRGKCVSDMRTTIIYFCAAGKAWSALSILAFAFGLFLALDRVAMPGLVFLLAVLFTITGVTNFSCARGLVQLLEKGRVLSMWTGIAALFLYTIFLYPILPEDDVRVVAASEIRGSLAYELLLLVVLMNKRIREVF